ncbi:unnamed protein product [Eruca vesicaria subsp. sativa]|uniref:Pentatricopeptide repeat-containing protein n=1 Tax=Eruca vesicaria subsp. sativa TaxID=29727 RepID=A0ABC8LW71_ERUVS|nr:unnamed protein product [Eruca vesicaria subsp. sativa]
MFEYLCANGKTRQAERVFRQLMKIGAQDPPSYRTLIMGHCREGSFKGGYELLVLMLRREFVPDLETYKLLIDGLLKTETNKTEHSTDVVRLLFSCGLKDKAFVVVRLVYENGYLVKMYELVDFLCENRNLVDSAHRLVMFCLENNQMVNIRTCNRVTEGLCKHKRHSKAFSFFNELVEIGKHQELSCHLVLRNALEAAGKLKEVRFVLKRMAMFR